MESTLTSTRPLDSADRSNAEVTFTEQESRA
jgi:hypothetical protein